MTLGADDKEQAVLPRARGRNRMTIPRDPLVSTGEHHGGTHVGLSQGAAKRTSDVMFAVTRLSSARDLAEDAGRVGTQGAIASHFRCSEVRPSACEKGFDRTRRSPGRI